MSEARSASVAAKAGSSSSKTSMAIRTSPTAWRRLIQRDSSWGALRKASLVSFRASCESRSQSTNPAAPVWVIIRTLARWSAGSRVNHGSRCSMAATLAEASRPDARSSRRRVLAERPWCFAGGGKDRAFVWVMMPTIVCPGTCGICMVGGEPGGWCGLLVAKFAGSHPWPRPNRARAMRHGGFGTPGAVLVNFQRPHAGSGGARTVGVWGARPPQVRGKRRPMDANREAVSICEAARRLRFALRRAASSPRSPPVGPLWTWLGFHRYLTHPIVLRPGREMDPDGESPSSRRG